MSNMNAQLWEFAKSSIRRLWERRRGDMGEVLGSSRKVVNFASFLFVGESGCLGRGRSVKGVRVWFIWWRVSFAFVVDVTFLYKESL